LKHQPWDSEPVDAKDGDIEWNMWQVRQHPYHQLDVGDRVVLVCGGGPANGMLTWEVEVTEVARGWYESHSEAWEILRRGLKDAISKSALTRRGFLSAPYTVGKPDAGWILAWSSRPVRHIMRSRPPELRMRPNGWATLDRNRGLASAQRQDGPRPHDRRCEEGCGRASGNGRGAQLVDRRRP